MPIFDEEKIHELLGNFQREHASLLTKVGRLEDSLMSLAEKGDGLPVEVGATLQEMAAFLQGEFLAHCQEDELLLFPLLRPYEGTRRAVPELVAEHETLRAAVDEFIRAFRYMVQRGIGVAELVRQHIRHEQSVLDDLGARVRPSVEEYREEECSAG